jgi:hypothetical protein
LRFAVQLPTEVVDVLAYFSSEPVEREPSLVERVAYGERDLVL